jgi:hypothetical protein
MPAKCGQPTCRAYRLTVSEFERLGGERWSQSFRVQLALRANSLHIEVYGKSANKVRSSKKREWRNKVGTYPCGILEQAYSELKRQCRDLAEDGQNLQTARCHPARE